jgi:PAS domain S-box-containing protein
MQYPIEQIQSLYEISLSIGNSLDLTQMLKSTLSTLLKKLNCAAGSIHFWENGLNGPPAYAIPRNIFGNPTYQAAMEQVFVELDSVVDPVTQPVLHFPMSGEPSAGHYYYILELPNIGFMVLIKNGQPLDPYLVKSLPPLQTKLAHACHACLQNTEVIEAHNKMMAFNTELFEISGQLENSRLELKQTLQELQDTANRNQAIIDALPDAMLYFNQQGDILDYKLPTAPCFLFAATAEHGDPPDQINLPPALYGTKLYSLLPPDIVRQFKYYVEQATITSERQQFEITVEIPGNSSNAPETASSARFFEVRLVISGQDEILTIVRDITDQKEAETKISHLAAVVEQVSETVLITDLHGRIIYVNPYFEISTGYTAAEAIGQTPRLYQSREYSLNVDQNIWQTITKGQVWKGRLVNQRKNGDLYYEDAVIFPITDEFGTIINYAAVKKDITEELKTEQHIRNLARFPAENPAPMLRVTRDGLLIYANRAAHQMLDEWGIDINQPVPPFWQKTVTEAFNSDQPLQIEAKFQTHIYSFQISAVSEAVYANIYAVDITARKLAEQALQESETRLRAMIETAPDGIISINEQGLIEMFNPAAETLFGYRADEVLGKDVCLLMPSPHRKQHNQYLSNYLKTGRKNILNNGREMEGQRKDGTVFPIYLSVSEVQVNQRWIFTAIIHDITNRKQAEEALKKSEQTLSATMKSMDDLVFVLDETGRFVEYYQPHTDRRLHIPPEQFLNRPYQQVLPPHLRDLMTAAIKSLTGSHNTQQFDYPLEMNNQQLWFNAKLSQRTDRKGRPAGVTAVVRDITERYELNRLRDEFVSTVSHELRTPLASIMGWTETILSEDPGPLTDLQRRFLTIIESSGDRLNKLVEEILMVSRIQQDTFQLVVSSLSPSALVNNIKEMVLSLAEAKSIDLVVEDNWPSGQLFTGDADRLEQVVINLIGNAIKFSPEGGQVRVQSFAQAGHWYFEVEDNGIGIAVPDLPHLFKRFFRANTATEAQIHGTGLGLYVCKAIIEQHGGKIGLDSKLGQGTRSWFTI